MLRFGFAVAVAFGLQGCAYLTTYQASVGDPTTGVAMDAKQRLLLVNEIRDAKGEKIRRMCAEPSPDALSALGASVGASILSDVGANKQLAAALGESTASIGLRTTSIQLMRDAMYRACEAYLSGGIDDGYYASLQAHSQTLIVGLLAIEQLTGAVQAQQVKLTTDSSAGALPDVVAETDNLVQAKKATLAQQEVVDQATQRKAAADNEYADKKVGLAKARTNAPAADITKLEDELKTLDTAAMQADMELKSQVGLLKIQQDAEHLAQEAFDMARSRVRASVKGAGEFSQQQTKGNMSTETAKALAQSVSDIVRSVVGTGEEQFRCLNLMSRPMNGTLDPRQWQALVDLCGTVAKAAADEQATKAIENESYRSKLKQQQPK
jgi:hypothetical protein